MIRIGKVMSVNASAKSVCVRFAEQDIISAPLKVLTFKTRAVLDETVINADSRLPAVNDVVLCIYENGFNSDGYVLGVIK